MHNIHISNFWNLNTALSPSYEFSYYTENRYSSLNQQWAESETHTSASSEREGWGDKRRIRENMKMMINDDKKLWQWLAD